jgi:diacylglycerol O-acyltransferase / wax synthase
MSTGRALNPLDWAFLAAESGPTMMHVGAMMTFSPPPRFNPELLREMMDEVRTQTRAYPPWSLKLRHPDWLASPLQRWVEDRDFDPEYHVRRSALPKPGDERELGILVSRLHSHPIDFKRPPWEVHFIEGLEGGRIALYFKVHHALVDGYTGIKLLSRSLSSTAEETDKPLFFALPPERRERGSAVDAAVATFESLLGKVRTQFATTAQVGSALKQALQPKKSGLVAPMQAPKSIINRTISRNRRFATQQVPLKRLKAVAKGYGGTVNDVALALCSIALRRWARELAALPDAPLTAMLPVNIRPKDDPGGGNAVGAILASLATDIDDPAECIAAIIDSTQRAKAQLQGMSANGIMQYSALLMAPLLLSQVPGTVGRIRPAFNLVVSNVPGPADALYFRGFKMEAYYPISIPLDGYGLNITLVSYGDQLNFGFIGCRDSVPHLQRLAVYAGEALGQLEAGLKPPAKATRKR